jgi:tetratricopeptide (TPR) repeat protein
MIFCGALLTLLLFAIVVPAWAQSASPQETLNQYVADLQKSPDDTALREKIIKHVQSMKRAPAIPEEAREHYVMATTFAEKAKDDTEKAKGDSDLKLAISGFERAIEQYKAALLAAPWWADAYKKQAINQKAAHRYDDAITSLNLYLLTQPADARDAQDEIYKLKALRQAAQDDEELAARKAAEERAAEEAKESSPEAVAARKQQQEQRFIESLNGAAFTRTEAPGNGWVIINRIVIKDGKAVYWDKNVSWPSFLQGVTREWRKGDVEGQIRGREWKLETDAWATTCLIDEDGSSITCHHESINPNNQLPPYDSIYRRE